MGVGSSASALVEMSRKHTAGPRRKYPNIAAAPDTANDSPLYLELLTTTPALLPRVDNVSHGGLDLDVDEFSESNFVCYCCGSTFVVGY